jgi:putative phage-type endonuclease
VQQRSEEWFRARAGKFSGSRFADLMAVTRSGPSASRRNLLATLAVERLTGTCVETYTNAAMERGTALEAEARDAYAFDQSVAVVEVGFITHPKYPFIGVSPDGLVGDDGMVELKAPASMAKHLDALRTNAHAAEYRWQLQGQLLVAERDWVDAVSYDPRFPANLRLAICRVEWSPKDHEALIEACVEAEAEVCAMVEELTNLRKAA